jgi:SAM-dependent methyltransferase
MPKLVTNCVLCGVTREQFRPYADVSGWRYVRCANCGLVFLNPQPTEEELGIFYNHSYNYDLRRYKDSIPQQRVWLDLLEQFKSPGNLLEVGCSYGYFLAAAQERGWSARGVELGKEAAEFARTELGLPVERGRILDLPRTTARTFDAIVAWHVLEHDPEPYAFLEAAYDLLRPGGILALRVPNLDSTVAKLSGARWQWLSPPEHVCMYTLDTLSQFLVQRGFEILTSRTARGNSRNIWFEVLRARIKMAVSSTPNERAGQNEQFRFHPPTVYQDRLWYRAGEELVKIGTMPVDWLVSRWMSKRGKEAELAVLARKPIPKVRQISSAPPVERRRA